LAERNRRRHAKGGAEAPFPEAAPGLHGWAQTKGLRVRILGKKGEKTGGKRGEKVNEEKAS